MQLRLAAPADGAEVAAVYAPYVESTAVSFELVAPTADEMGARIEQVLDAHPWIVATGTERAPGVVVGYAHAHAFAARPAYRWSVETAIYLRSEARGQGVGSALYTALLGLVAAQGYRRAFAGIALPNPASVALHERLGFRPAGVYERVGFKHGAWHDVSWWQRDLDGAAHGAPDEPVPLARLDPATLARHLAAR